MTTAAELKPLRKDEIRTNILKEQNRFRATLRLALHSPMNDFMIKQLKARGLVSESKTGNPNFADAIVGVILQKSLDGNLKAIKLLVDLTDIPPQKQMAPEGLMRLDDNPQNCIESGS